MKGNQRQPHDCPYCWSVLYSKSALTAHINKFHARTKSQDEFLLTHEMLKNAPVPKNNRTPLK